MIEYLLMGAGAVLFGFLAALLGIGGGLFVIPWLTLVFDLPMHNAIATSLIAIIATSSGASSVYVKNKIPDLKLAFSLELSAAVGAMLGGFMAGLISANTLSLLFSLVLAYAAWNMLKNKPEESLPDTLDLNYQVKNYSFGYPASFLAGNLSGLLGVGGGIVKVPVLHLVMGVPLKIATATSNFMLGMTACASAFLYYFRGQVDFLVTGVVVLGIFWGSRLGSLYLFRIKSSILRPIFALILLIVAIRMFLKGTNLSVF